MPLHIDPYYRAVNYWNISYNVVFLSIYMIKEIISTLKFSMFRFYVSIFTNHRLIWFTLCHLIRYASTLSGDFLKIYSLLATGLLRKGYKRFQLIATYKELNERHCTLIGNYIINVTSIYLTCS